MPALISSDLPIHYHLPDLYTNDDEPLRLPVDDGFSLSEMARQIGAIPIANDGRRTRKNLLGRVRANHRTLVEVHRVLISDRVESPGTDAEWLLDNFHVIDDVFYDVLTHLPEHYYQELPALAGGAFDHLPRTYALAVGLLVNTDSAVNEQLLREYISATQEVNSLDIGELWAIPTMLRIGLLESLARLARQLRNARSEQVRAHQEIHRVSKSGAIELPERATDAYVVGVLHALRELHEVRAELDERVRMWLTQQNVEVEVVLRREHQRQAGNQVSIGNAITSLRLLASLDWPNFFEDLSATNQTLRTESAGNYVQLSFGTRDTYRTAVERFARGSKTSEVEVAKRAIALAERRDDSPANHVGYYLVDDGRTELAKDIRYRPKWRDVFQSYLTAHPDLVYFGMFSGLLVGLLAIFGALANPTSWPLAVLVIALLALPLSEAAIAVLNLLIGRMLPPRRLPRMDYRDGIPTEFSTFVVIPGMLTKPGSVRALVDRLELHHLANPDANLYFALLTDFADAPSEVMPDDESILVAAMEAVRVLNVKYPVKDGPPRFSLLHRRRLHNPQEGCWMGWERKRGKLHEFNRLIRGATDTSYRHTSTDAGTLPRTRFVLTLDSDTVLPKDAARILIGTLAHPLNRPRLSTDGRRVIAGYAILQPRVSFLYRTSFRSPFAKVFAYSAGIDPYSSATSDTYMDLFARGTFTGKGLYDVDAFEATLGRAFPDNRILSHDLIESAFARCGLVSDVEVFDDFPAKYLAYSRREHRWARGDWQLLPWLARRIPTADVGLIPNPLPLLERWKVVDNLRRTVVPAALIVMVAIGWTLMPAVAWLWTLILIGVVAAPLILQLVAGVLAVPAVGIRQSWINTQAGVPYTGGQVALSIVFLAHQACTLLDAIGRTIWRLAFSRRRMLEWETAAATESRLKGGAALFATQMWGSCATAMLLCGLLFAFAPTALLAASPLLAAWLFAPLLAWAVSRPSTIRDINMSEEDRKYLRRLACKTWGFFEAFVGEEDRYLPPDNFQEGPVKAVAHRTSPTNIGLLLTSTLAAHDLGYITLTELADRLERTMETLGHMERYRGHFLNWYDTQTLVPLPPAYVSTVDSGNLLACLIVLAQGLQEKIRAPLPSDAALQGLEDRLELLLEGLGPQSAPGAELNKATVWSARMQQFTELAEHYREMGAPGARFFDAVQKQQLEWETLFPVPATTASATLVELAKTPEQGPASELLLRLSELTDTARRLADEMDFSLLYNSTRQLFAIGYHVPRETLDQAHYDLLASEACITSFLAVSRGDAPRKHWFQLGRPFIQVAGHTGLLSWSGTMFEYLMPRLFLPVPEGTLLDAAWRAAVARQIEYGKQLRLPWGVSESGYNLTDRSGNYQYQAFGVPGLGLKRGLGHDRVIAPYATVLAVGLVPQEAIANIRRLQKEEAEGEYGLYEAIDHTPDRLPEGQAFHVVRSYMAHHQGMSLLAITNVLLDGIMPARFGRVPSVRAVELLLQERVPLDIAIEPLREPEATALTPALSDAVSRKFTTPVPREPRPHLLSNGRYSVMLTTSGSGYSRCNDLDITRWRNDPTNDCYGEFIYVRDLSTGACWSAGHQPVCRPADYFEAIYSIDKVEFSRRDGDFETLLEVVVSPEFDAEVRRVTIVNHSSEAKELELTSYSEIVLASHAADVTHPAFHKLFVETEWLPEPQALLARRRPRQADQQPVWAVHVFAAEVDVVTDVSYETDRAKFIGRRGTLAAPQLLMQPLTGSTGPVLDPVFSLRTRIRINGNSQATVCFTTALVTTRDAANALADRFHNLSAVDRTFELAWAHSRVELKHFNLSIREAQLYQRLAGAVLFPTALLRASHDIRCGNRQGQSALWRHGISGDLPIMLVHLLPNQESMALLRRVLTAHSYWRNKGLLTDLVILNEAATSYHDELSNDVMGLIRGSESRDRVDRPGGVFVRKSDQFSSEDRGLLTCWARVILHVDRGSLEDQIGQSSRPPRYPQDRRFTTPVQVNAGTADKPSDLLFYNDIGGFTRDGREYVIAPVIPTAAPPMPWVNVMANSRFGCLITDSGGGYTWATNSQMQRLTPWQNDPISDAPGEIVYLRDDQTGEIWTPTPLPAGGPVVVRHGTGYTVFASRRGTLEQELTVFVPLSEMVKVSRLRLTNRGRTARKLTVTYYVEWVLGTNRDRTAEHLLSEYLPGSGGLLVRNPSDTQTAPAIGFVAMTPRPNTFTTDRSEFLGRSGKLSQPAALRRDGLSGSIISGDPCAALQTEFELKAGQSIDVICLLGRTEDAAAAESLFGKYRNVEFVEAALAAVKQDWDDLCSVIQVHTPAPEIDLLCNRWLMYQTVSSRLWGRTGLYQSGGAYGFRDQLQDVMAVVFAKPTLAREQILRAAGRQFREGDVQHWWHPPGGQGVRTRFSDDFLWLPFVVCHYAEVTGEKAVFDEVVPFLDAPLLEAHQEDSYSQPRTSSESGTIYEHCSRALENGWKLGENGLPLMGCGDWNDGMSKVGAGGKGESVWVAWFQVVCYERFALVAESRGDTERAGICRARATQLREAAEAAWDGSWYRRAYFDDGTPLGSSENDECRIDSIAQSWSVFAGGNPERSKQAVAAAVRQLVRPGDGLILLLDPPFDVGRQEPGYIKGYVPGTRENGGQYTHASLWLLKAVAQQGEQQLAADILAILNPIRHSSTAKQVGRYQVEPYVVAADVYSMPPHTGRGGWTWYTGSAGWFYQVLLLDILGIRRLNDRLTFAPCVPPSWTRFEVNYQHGTSRYEIHFKKRTATDHVVEVDGVVTNGEVALIDDAQTHQVVVRIL